MIEPKLRGGLSQAPMFDLQEIHMEKSIKFIKTWQDRMGYFEYSVKLRKRKRKNRIICGLQLNVFFKTICSVFRFPAGFYGVKYLEIPITTACNLKCRDCANLMQYYQSDYNKRKQLM